MFYLLSNLIFLSIGVLLQKKIVQKNPKVSLFVIVFYIYSCSSIVSFFIFHLKYSKYHTSTSTHNTKEDFMHDYLHSQYFLALGSITMIFISLILAEAFRYITLLYINKMGHISKVTLYGGLHGFYVVIIWIIFEETFNFDYFFVSMIIIAYCTLFFSKYSLSRSSKSDNSAFNKVKFVRAIKDLEHADKFTSLTKLEIDRKYFYRSTQRFSTTQGLIYDRINSEVVRDSYYASSPDVVNRESASLQSMRPSLKNTQKMNSVPKRDEEVKFTEEQELAYMANPRPQLSNKPKPFSYRM